MKWALSEEESERWSSDKPWHLGITFWDTANVYGFGSSEEIVGRAIKKYTRREDIVLATKLFYPMHSGPGDPERPARRSWSRSTRP
ncbi:Aryl-alcohol dehydrogenase-like predicted oxidoreductase OS=Streptomyces violarus OX=67380 GN=FHS41_000168 PE=4 SV=1 [Streptomyces violarus]